MNLTGILDAAQRTTRPSALKHATCGLDRTLAARIAARIVTSSLQDPHLAGQLAGRSYRGGIEPEMDLTPADVGPPRSAEALAEQLRELSDELVDPSERRSWTDTNDLVSCLISLRIWNIAHRASAAFPAVAAHQGHDAVAALARLLARWNGEPAAGGSRTPPPAAGQNLQRSTAEEQPENRQALRSLARTEDDLPELLQVAAQEGARPQPYDQHRSRNHTLADLTGGSAGHSAICRTASIWEQLDGKH